MYILIWNIWYLYISYMFYKLKIGEIVFSLNFHMMSNNSSIIIVFFLIWQYLFTRDEQRNNVHTNWYDGGGHTSGLLSSCHLHCFLGNVQATNCGFNGLRVPPVYEIREHFEKNGRLILQRPPLPWTRSQTDIVYFEELTTHVVLAGMVGGDTQHSTECMGPDVVPSCHARPMHSTTNHSVQQHMSDQFLFYYNYKAI